MSTNNERGTTLIELIVMLGIIGVVCGMVIPALANAVDRNKVVTGAELVATTIRSARLSAITRNATYRINFACPSAGRMRVLVVTGDPTIDDAADRCTVTLAADGPVLFLPQGVDYGTVPTVQINSRGQMSVPSPMPLMITVSYENFTRVLSVSAAGRVVPIS